MKEKYYTFTWKSHNCCFSCVALSSEMKNFNNKETEGRQGWAKLQNVLEKPEQLERYMTLKATRQIHGRNIYSAYTFWLLNLKHFLMGSFSSTVSLCNFPFHQGSVTGYCQKQGTLQYWLLVLPEGTSVLACFWIAKQTKSELVESWFLSIYTFLLLFY